MVGLVCLQPLVSTFPPISLLPQLDLEAFLIGEADGRDWVDSS